MMHLYPQNRSYIGVVTLSQQYGSGGYSIAAKLAFRLQWALTDQEISQQVARQLELSNDEAALYDEHALGLLDRLLLYLRYTSPEVALDASLIVPLTFQEQERLYRENLQRVIVSLACRGEQIIVGHAAQVVLARRPDVLHVRIVASLEQRIERVMSTEHLNERNARTFLKRHDQKVAHYLQSQHGRDIDDPLLYDLLLNSDVLDAESHVDLICLTLKRKEQLQQSENWWRSLATIDRK